jgi:hypothetical protein
MIVLVLLVASVLTACGGGDDQAAPLPAGGDTTAAPVATTSGTGSGEAGGIEDQTFDVGEGFWHSGFRFDVLSGEIATVENELTGARRTTLTLDLTLENTGEGEGFFDADVAVATANNSYLLDPLNDLGLVPGGMSSQGAFVFAVDDGFDLATAELIVGGADVNQARVPLSGSGDAVRLEPMAVDISGTLSMELIDLVVTGGDLRYDIPQRHRQAEAGMRALTLNFDVVSRNSGNWNVFDADLALVRPDGTAIGADGSEIGSLPGSDAGTTTRGRFVRFLVDEPSAGDYVLRLTPGNWFVGADGVTEGTFEFTIP